MIVRTWRGKVPREHASGFLVHLQATGVAAYRAQPACAAIQIWRREESGWVHFTLVSQWRDFAALRDFAGHDPAVAVLYPGDEAFGLRPERQAEHFELVFAEAAA